MSNAGQQVETLAQIAPVPDYTLDTSSAVLLSRAFLIRAPVAWTDLQPFEEGYVAGALRDAAGTLGRDAAGDGFGFASLAPSTLAQLRGDCRMALTFIYGGQRTADLGFAFWEARQLGCLRSAYGQRPYGFRLGRDGKLYLCKARARRSRATRTMYTVRLERLAPVSAAALLVGCQGYGVHKPPQFYSVRAEPFATPTVRSAHLIRDDGASCDFVPSAPRNAWWEMAVDTWRPHSAGKVINWKRNRMNGEKIEKFSATHTVKIDLVYNQESVSGHPYLKVASDPLKFRDGLPYALFYLR